LLYNPLPDKVVTAGGIDSCVEDAGLSGPQFMAVAPEWATRCNAVLNKSASVALVPQLDSNITPKISPLDK
jgi:hypothetical protein